MPASNSRSHALTLAFAALALAPAAAVAQSRSPTRVIPAELASAVVGSWHCAGSFASGRPIESDLQFVTALDGSWLIGSQVDRAPNRFAFRTAWNVDAAGRVRSIAIDNIGGSRRFASPPLTDGVLRFETDTATAADRRERFTYRRRADTLALTYEVGRQNGPWVLGDSLSCRRADRAIEIRAVLDSTAAGWNRGDLARYLWAYDDSMTALGATGMEHGKALLEATMRGGFWKSGRPLQQLRYEQIEVRPLGAEYALVTGKFVLTGAGRPDRTGWFSTTWARTPNGWRMIHDHSS